MSHVRSKPRLSQWALALLSSAMLAGCGADLGELQQWMDQQKREAKPNVPPLQPPKKFDPQPYTVADAVEPFSTQKLAVALGYPWKRVDAEKSKHVIDAKIMEYLGALLDALTPPMILLLLVSFPVVEWQTPVLSPFCGELVVLKPCFRWRTTRPFKVE